MAEDLPEFNLRESKKKSPRKAWETLQQKTIRVARKPLCANPSLVLPDKLLTTPN